MDNHLRNSILIRKVAQQCKDTILNKAVANDIRKIRQKAGIPLAGFINLESAKKWLHKNIFKSILIGGEQYTLYSRLSGSEIKTLAKKHGLSDRWHQFLSAMVVLTPEQAIKAIYSENADDFISRLIPEPLNIKPILRGTKAVGIKIIVNGIVKRRDILGCEWLWKAYSMLLWRVNMDMRPNGQKEKRNRSGRNQKSIIEVRSCKRKWIMGSIEINVFGYASKRDLIDNKDLWGKYDKILNECFPGILQKRHKPPLKGERDARIMLKNRMTTSAIDSVFGAPDLDAKDLEDIERKTRNVAKQVRHRQRKKSSIRYPYM